jgi:hypothetical protein
MFGDGMDERMTAQELIRFERRWKGIFTFFALILAASIFVYHFRLVDNARIIWIVAIGVASLIGALFAANQLRDPERRKGVFEGLETLDDD